MQFLEKLYNIEDIDKANDHCFRELDKLLWSNNINELNNIFTNIDFSKIDASTGISVFMATFPLRDKIPIRESVRLKFWEYLYLTHDKNEADQIIKHLK